MSSFSSHRRKNSGELDVFEATRYFSGGPDTAPAPLRAVRGDYRMSLDMPIEAKAPTRVDLMMKNHIKEKVIKCNKQPSSPGGRLVTFINSFFHQYSASKKNKASKKGDQEESSGGRRRRMSVTTCYYSSSCTSTTSSLHSISKKRELDDHHQGFNYNYNKDHEDQYWGGGELRVKMRLGDELNLKNIIKDQDIIKGFRDEDEDEDDEGGESDSSSDLFELKNYHHYHHEFGDEISSGLPVYGSTDMRVIGRGAGSFASTVAY